LVTYRKQGTSKKKTHEITLLMMTWVVLRDSSFCARLVRKTITKIGFCKHTPTSWFYILTLSLLLWFFSPRIILLRFLQRCEQWDVNNENLHETFYADLADDDTITQQMFEQIHALDPDTPLFINDYDVLSE